MLTTKEARIIANNACINKLGYDFVSAYRDSAVASYGEWGEGMYCYIGVNDSPTINEPGDCLVLDSVSKWPYYASCLVNMETGDVKFLECVIPDI